jgi:hypothetical protein
MRFWATWSARGRAGRGVGPVPGQVETKSAIAGLKDALAATARELAVEQQHLTDAERRSLPRSRTRKPQARRDLTTKHRERVAI